MTIKVRSTRMTWILAGIVLLCRPAYPAECPDCGRTVGYGPGPGVVQPDRHLCRWYQESYNSTSSLYGYPDSIYGRGPLVDLGAASLGGGFRGYGTIRSPGYGLGVAPSSRLDTLGPPSPGPKRRLFRWGHR